MLDSGNFSDNPTPEGDVKTKALLAAMHRLGYEVVNVGERDIRMGYEEFQRRIEAAPFHFISANIVRHDTLQPVFEPHVIVEASSADEASRVRVGVTGAVRFNPIFLKAGPDKSNLVIVQPLERVKH
jgi:2',3'-cyclic-nucleotide 2'-phosphodiesterase (5'-nucleotidase family)